MAKFAGFLRRRYGVNSPIAGSCSLQLQHPAPFMEMPRGASSLLAGVLAIRSPHPCNFESAESELRCMTVTRNRMRIRHSCQRVPKGFAGIRNVTRQAICIVAVGT
jgi:hypothetical protein